MLLLFEARRRKVISVFFEKKIEKGEGGLGKIEKGEGGLGKIKTVV